MKACELDECEKPARGRGLCQMHYSRLIRTGTTDSREDVIFRKCCQPLGPSECWEWTGHRWQGYGRIGHRWAHRVSYERTNGPIPDGLQIDHLCGNPPCVNPNHLEAVTPRTNLLRGSAPAALVAQMGRCMKGHELTPENTYWRPDGAGRQCRICIRLRTQKATTRRRARAAATQERAA